MKVKTHYHDEIERLSRFDESDEPQLNDAYFEELVEMNPSFCADLIRKLVEETITARQAMVIIELLQPIDNERDFDKIFVEEH